MLEAILEVGILDFEHPSSQTAIPIFFLWVYNKNSLRVLRFSIHKKKAALAIGCENAHHNHIAHQQQATNVQSAKNVNQ